jgi:hypothetical protein
MSFEFGRPLPAAEMPRALEMLRHTGFGLQGCLLFSTQRGGAIGHPGLRVGVHRTGPDTDKARQPASGLLPTYDSYLLVPDVACSAMS